MDIYKKIFRRETGRFPRPLERRAGILFSDHPRKTDAFELQDHSVTGTGELPGFLNQQNVTGFRPEDIQGMYLNLSYDGLNLTCITGISMKTFTMDKSLERAWDDAAQKSFWNWNLSCKEKGGTLL